MPRSGLRMKAIRPFGETTPSGNATGSWSAFGGGSGSEEKEVLARKSNPTRANLNGIEDISTCLPVRRRTRNPEPDIGLIPATGSSTRLECKRQCDANRFTAGKVKRRRGL